MSLRPLVVLSPARPSTGSSTPFAGLHSTQLGRKADPKGAKITQPSNARSPPPPSPPLATYSGCWLAHQQYLQSSYSRTCRPRKRPFNPSRCTRSTKPPRFSRHPSCAPATTYLPTYLIMILRYAIPVPWESDGAAPLLHMARPREI